MKKFIKKLTKKTEGFTLVELIVVIAILGILAGVALPAYSGYIKKAEEAKYTQTLAAVHTAASAVLAGEGKAVSTINVEGVDGDDSAKVTVTPALTATGADFAKDFKFYFEGNDIPTGLKAEYKDGAWKITNKPS